MTDSSLIVAFITNRNSPNPNAFSRYIPGEDTRDHGERKSFILPCGKTLAQSWAGLRKAWLGFKIARSNGDRALMTHYASFIIKVQKEMGLQVTTFGSDIIDDTAFCEIIGRRFDEKFVENGCTIQEDDPDYDSIMDVARSKVNHKAKEMATPCQNIFDQSKTSCLYITQEKKENKLQPKITAQERHIEKSYKYILPEKPSKPRGGGFCYRKYPDDSNEGQSRDKTKGMGPQQMDIEDDPSSYKFPGKGIAMDTSQGEKRRTEHPEKKTEGSVHHSCFYKSKR